ncbi:MAG: glycoside hydrolase family 27 protein [Pyrinomonadaceae bacterium]|nr:glycoside hydrolase family 27 protein [Pyrinomonadaceae bacterium]
MKILLQILILFSVLSVFGQTNAKENLAPTPPMGWNSWNKFGCKIDEKLIRETADAMISSGMKDAGFIYLNIDDCWMADKRDANGDLQADPIRFPNGIKSLADYAHSKGLKLGVYSSAGTKTCEGLPASLDYETADAKKFAEWGVDLLKYDNCNNQKRPFIPRYQAMAEALRKTGRPILFSICEWGENKPWQWADNVGGHIWRTTGDIRDNWQSVMRLLDLQVGLEKYSKPNAWNDPDMLEVGNGSMTDAEYRSHFSLWALLNAPLFAGNDLRTMKNGTKDILTNREVIAVNQDWGGSQGYKLRDDGDSEVWIKPMSDGSRAVVLLNRNGSDIPVSISVSPKELGLSEAKKYTAHNLWTKTNQTVTKNLTASVAAHNSAMFIIKPAK